MHRRSDLICVGLSLLIYLAEHPTVSLVRVTKECKGDRDACLFLCILERGTPVDGMRRGEIRTFTVIRSRIPGSVLLCVMRRLEQKKIESKKYSRKIRLTLPLSFNQTRFQIWSPYPKHRALPLYSCPFSLTRRISAV